MGKLVAALYLATIAVCSLALGWIVDQIYSGFKIDVSRWVHTAATSTESPLTIVASGVLLFLILRNYFSRSGNGKTDCDCDSLATVIKKTQL